jgi:hypothetical protein
MGSLLLPLLCIDGQVGTIDGKNESANSLGRPYRVNVGTLEERQKSFRQEKMEDS